MSLTAHPVAALLPDMSEDEYAELRESIASNGLRAAITLHRNGRIIDGRHRARACAELGVPLASTVFEGSDNNLLAFVLDLNLKRRHLDESQRAMVAAKLAKPPPDETDGARQKRPAREKQQLPDKGEIRRLIGELHAELTSNDKETVQEAARLCRALSLRAAERLGLIVTGIQPATVPQVAMSSITVLKGAGVVGKGDAGITAETTE